jgi:hypothetical protein
VKELTVDVKVIAETYAFKILIRKFGSGLELMDTD